MARLHPQRATSGFLVTAALTMTGAAFMAAPASAKITPTRSAARLASAITPANALFKPTTKFSVIPPDNNPIALSTSRLGRLSQARQRVRHHDQR